MAPVFGVVGVWFLPVVKNEKSTFPEAGRKLLQGPCFDPSRQTPRRSATVARCRATAKAPKTAPSPSLPSIATVICVRFAVAGGHAGRGGTAHSEEPAAAREAAENVRAVGVCVCVCARARDSLFSFFLSLSLCVCLRACLQRRQRGAAIRARTRARRCDTSKGKPLKAPWARPTQMRGKVSRP